MRTRDVYLKKAAIQVQNGGISGHWMKEEQIGDQTVNSTTPVVAPSSVTLPLSNSPQLKWCQGCLEMKREVQEMKQNIEKKILLLACQMNGTTGTENPTILSSFSPVANVLKSSPPECPVALRPLPACSLNSLYWNTYFPQLFPRTDASLPTLALQEALQSTTAAKNWNSTCILQNGNAPKDVNGDSSTAEGDMGTKRTIFNNEPINNLPLFASRYGLSLNSLYLQQMQQLMANGQAEQLQATLQLHQQLQQRHQQQQHLQQQQPLQINPMNVEAHSVSALPSPLSALSSAKTLPHQHLVQQFLNNQNQTVQAVVNQQQQQQQCSQRHSVLPPPTERKKVISDDFVKYIRRKGIHQGSVAAIQIPVPQAFESDPEFTPASEEQIIQQFHQNRRCEEDVRKAMAFLSKMLAEKRVFGTKLMAQTTVAGPNHSTYKNLPEEGIHYIAYICRKVMMKRIPEDEEFWEVFRDVTRKLAARCRRVRHSKKILKNKALSGRHRGVVPIEAKNL